MLAVSIGEDAEGKFRDSHETVMRKRQPCKDRTAQCRRLRSSAEPEQRRPTRWSCSQATAFS